MEFSVNSTVLKFNNGRFLPVCSGLGNAINLTGGEAEILANFLLQNLCSKSFRASRDSRSKEKCFLSKEIELLGLHLGDRNRESRSR